MDPEESSTMEEQFNRLASHVQNLERQLAQVANQPPTPVQVQVQQPVSTGHLKPVKPSQYDGKSRSYDVNTWLSEMERYFMASGIEYTDPRCVPFAVSMLRLDGSVWWDSYQVMAQMDESLVITVWPEFKDAIRAAFQPANINQDARDRLAILHQTKSVLNYTAEFNKLCIRIDDISESEKLDRYIRGLKPSVRKEVKIKDPLRLVEAVRIAQTIDNIEWSERKTFSSSYYPNRANYNGPAPMEVNNIDVEDGEPEINAIYQQPNRKRLDISKEDYDRRKQGNLCFNVESLVIAFEIAKSTLHQSQKTNKRSRTMF